MSRVVRDVVVTQGDPRGVGLELLLRLAADGELAPGDRVVADPEVLQHRAANIAQPWAMPGWLALRPLLDGTPGMTQTQALARGVDHVLDKPGVALLTAPIHKRAAQSEGFTYPGHTEYLAARAQAEVAMLMWGPTLRVVLATTHVSLADVPASLSQARIERAGRLLAEALRERFGFTAPKIAVLGLNPHAGEGGVLGCEEQTTVAPAIDTLRASCPFARFFGPLPADTAFFAHRACTYDAVVAMYHDQGLAPFKLVHFHDGVNVTLGLPFVRTSPDHGTALDIAGQGIANPASMRAALRLARGDISR